MKRVNISKSQQNQKSHSLFNEKHIILFFKNNLYDCIHEERVDKLDSQPIF